MTDNLPETASFKEFAGIAGFRPGYITQLKADDRLILTADGKRVRVAESLQRIADTRDPSKIGVVRRHAAEREAGDEASADAPNGESAPAQQSHEGEGGTVGFQHWRERSERAKALAAERENAIADGKLMRADEVAAAIAHHTAALRGRLESLPDILAPQVVAARDEAKARALIADAIEHALGEISRAFGELARAA